MTEWWTYRPSDFLMFAPRTYWRMFELQHQAWWPLPLLALAAGLAGWAWIRRGGGPGLRAAAAGLAAAWAFVAWDFLAQRYLPINWAASGLVAGAAGLVVLLLLLAARTDLRLRPPGPRRTLGEALLGWALLGHPLLALGFGRPWTQAEWFGLAPDPTLLATLGWCLLAAPQARATRALRALVAVLAGAGAAFSAATLATMAAA